MSNLGVPDSFVSHSHGDHPACRLLSQPGSDEMLPAPGMRDSRVLLMHDESEQASILIDRLRQQGCHVTMARSSCQFFEMALQMRTDLIVLHLMSARIDGPALCAALKTDTSLAAIPVIFMTGTSSTRNRVLSLAAGAVDHIQAPFDWREVFLRMAIQRKARVPSLAGHTDT